jgi:hypothetical protein
MASDGYPTPRAGDGKSIRYDAAGSPAMPRARVKDLSSHLVSTRPRRGRKCARPAAAGSLQGGRAHSVEFARLTSARLRFDVGRTARAGPAAGASVHQASAPQDHPRRAGWTKRHPSAVGALGCKPKSDSSASSCALQQVSEHRPEINAWPAHAPSAGPYTVGGGAGDGLSGRRIPRVAWTIECCHDEALMVNEALISPSQLLRA